MNDELKQKLNKFFQDPDWQLVVNMVEEHLHPLRDVTNIDMERSNDEIASEVRGRQLSIKGLEGFLTDAGVLTARTGISKPTTFK